MLAWVTSYKIVCQFPVSGGSLITFPPWSSCAIHLCLVLLVWWRSSTFMEAVGFPGYRYSFRASALRVRLRVLSCVRSLFLNFIFFNCFGLIWVSSLPRPFWLGRFSTWFPRVCFLHVCLPCLVLLSVCWFVVVLYRLPRAIRPCCVGGLVVHSIFFLLHGFRFIPPSHGALISHFLRHVACAGGSSRGFVCPFSGSAMGLCFLCVSLLRRLFSILRRVLTGHCAGLYRIVSRHLLAPVVVVLPPPCRPMLFFFFIFRRSFLSPPSGAHLVYVPGVLTTVTSHRLPVVGCQNSVSPYC